MTATAITTTTTMITTTTSTITTMITMITMITNDDGCDGDVRPGSSKHSHIRLFRTAQMRPEITYDDPRRSPLTGTQAKHMDQQGKISTLVRRNVPNSRTSDNVAIGTNRPRQRVNMPTFTHCHSQVAETLRNTNMFNARNVAQGRSARPEPSAQGR